MNSIPIFRSSHRAIFENICSFLPGAPFSEFFQEASCVNRTDTNFPERYIYLINEQILIFKEGTFVHRTDTLFPGDVFYNPAVTPNSPAFCPVASSVF